MTGGKRNDWVGILHRRRGYHGEKKKTALIGESIFEKQGAIQQEQPNFFAWVGKKKFA